MAKAIEKVQREIKKVGGELPRLADEERLGANHHWT
jgi:hypothetical protein